LRVIDDLKVREQQERKNKTKDMDDENMVKKKITESDKVVKTKIEMIIKGSKDKKSKAIDFLVDLVLQ